MNLHVAAIQTNLFWEDSIANLAMLEEKIATISQPIDLIVLPEMFTTGFTMNPMTFSEPMNFTTFKWLKQMAAQSGAAITGSFAVKDGQRYYNRLLFMLPDGSYMSYDKRHLFRMGGEDKVYEAGQKKIIVSFKGFHICPLICYDLRFPVWSRNVNLEYDILIYVANWPAARRNVWNTLLKARAIENQCYVVGVNRIGEDGNGLPHAGDSCFIDYKGEPTATMLNEEGIIYTTFEKKPLDDFREKFPAYLDADGFEISGY